MMKYVPWQILEGKYHVVCIQRQNCAEQVNAKACPSLLSIFSKLSNYVPHFAPQCKLTFESGKLFCRVKEILASSKLDRQTYSHQILDVLSLPKYLFFHLSNKSLWVVGR